MHVNRPESRRGLSMTACAVAIAATIGGSSLHAAGEAKAVEGIGRYCAASWRNARIAPQDWSDCTQQVFAELLSRVSRERMTAAIEQAASPERRELNRSVWCTIQRWRRAPRYCALAAEDVATEHAPGKEIERRATLREALATAEALSPRQRRILALYGDGWSIADIAGQLQIAPSRVSDEKYKAVTKLRRHLADGAASA